MTKVEMKKLREKLLKRKDALMGSVKDRRSDSRDTEVGDEVDAATDTHDKEMSFELTDMERQTLDDIEAALIKMERGVYGICEKCSKPILAVRLRAMPFTRNCIKCQTASEKPRE